MGFVFYDFKGFWLQFGVHVPSILNHFCIIDSALIFHRFEMDFGICVDVVLIHFPSSLEKNKFAINLNDFTIQRNMMVDDFHDLFIFQFWHSLLMTFGIDVGPCWNPFGINCHDFGD